MRFLLSKNITPFYKFATETLPPLIYLFINRLVLAVFFPKKTAERGYPLPAALFDNSSTSLSILYLY